jgi:uncharacterized protein
LPDPRWGQAIPACAAEICLRPEDSFQVVQAATMGSSRFGSAQNFIPLSRLMPKIGVHPQPGAFTPPRPAPEVDVVTEPSVQLGEIRQFAIAGREYAMVVATTGIFGLDELGAKILKFLRNGTVNVPVATVGEQVAGNRPVAFPKIYEAFEGQYSREEIRGVLSELGRMGAIRLRGVARDEPESAAPKLPPLPFPQKSLVLNVANDCNLGCSYCFASQGDYGAPRQMMDETTARRSVDFLLQNSGESDSVTVVFFGGEPLMNLALIRRLVVYANEAGRKAGKRVDFSMTTNATYLTPEVIEFLSDSEIGVAVSIDGPKKYHDLRRTYKSGLGSYDMIHPRVLDLLRNHKTRRVAARATLTHGVTAVEECFWYLKEMGFHEVGFAPVTSADRDDYALTPDELWEIMGAFRRLSRLYVEKAAKDEYLGFSNLSNLLSELHAGIVKTYPCGAGLGLLGVGAKGDLYLCHRFLESPEHRLGSVFDGVDQERQAEFLENAHLSRKAPCQTCWVRHICSGGCHHEAHTRYGDLYHGNPHYCEWIRTWIDLGLESYGEIMEKNQAFFERVIERRS